MILYIEVLLVRHHYIYLIDTRKTNYLKYKMR